MEKATRNRTLTMKRIVDALEEVIAEKGVEGVGINRVAEKAGVSKVLIYRYFGGIDGLLTHYIKMGRLFPLFNLATLEQLRPVHEEDFAKLWYKQVIHIYRYFRQSPAAIEILKTVVTAKGSTAEEVSKAYDEELMRVVKEMAFIKGVDFQAISAIMVGAMSYLTLLSQGHRTLVGIDLATEEGWRRIEEAVRFMYTALNRMAIQSPHVLLEVHQTSLSSRYW